MEKNRKFPNSVCWAILFYKDGLSSYFEDVNEDYKTVPIEFGSLTFLVMKHVDPFPDYTRE